VEVGRPAQQPLDDFARRRKVERPGKEFRAVELIEAGGNGRKVGFTVRPTKRRGGHIANKKGGPKAYALGFLSALSRE
jgi:hypothetical protein